jgi:TPP-dependent pyruvate/acetoin dehydrogenase alpha subunit
MVEVEIAKRYSEQKMRCPVHLSIGQEAPSAAFALAIQVRDYAVSTHRGHAHYLAKSGNLSAMIAEIYGKETGCSKGRGGSMHLADKAVGFMGTSAIVGNSIPVGVGLALSLQVKKIEQASVIFLGDGAIEEGVFYESANFAAVRNLPAVFLCENNEYSVYSSLPVRQPAGRQISDLAAAIGLTSKAVDGNDVEVSYGAIDSALRAARNGEGPQFIEFKTYRHLEHCGPNDDDHLGYRPLGELQAWLDKDPVSIYQSELENLGIISSELVSSIRSIISQEIDDAFEAAEAASFPVMADFTDGVYAY